VVAMAAASAGGGRGGGAKAAVGEQIAQAVQSTSNLLQLMEESSPAQVSPSSHILSSCLIPLTVRFYIRFVI
jgi:hypothetical protein